MRRLQQETLFAGRYLLMKQVGIGGFSEVWEAQDQEVEGVTVALKIYAPGRGLDDDGINLFRKEYATTSPINHPHLLKVQYFGVFEGSPYLIMPYCANGSLGALLNQGKTFSENEVAILLKQIAGALAYLHSRNPSIIHQDIKPDNVLINEDGNYQLTDFGISSRMRHTMAKSTGKPETALSIAYAPPERFSGTPRSLKASDIFSLGVMLYELCTGDVPWMGNGGAALLRGAEVPNLPPGYSKRFNELVKSCLQLDPDQRPAAAQLTELANKYDREGYWDLLGSETKKPTDKVKTGPDTIPRRKNWVPALAALLLVLVSAGGLWYYRNQSASPQRVPETSAIAVSTPEAEVFITAEERSQKYRLYLIQGDAHFRKKGYKTALLQYFIAQAFAPEDKRSWLEKKILQCEKLIRSAGAPTREIQAIRKEANEKVKQILTPKKPSTLASTPTKPAETAPPPAVVPETASGNTVEKPRDIRMAANWVRQGEELFRNNQFEQAFILFNRAAQEDSPEGHYFTGLSYSLGKGVRQDWRKAREHFQKAAAKGFELANYPLSTLYRNARGGPADKNRAEDYLVKSIPSVVIMAEKGNVFAQTYHGEILENGLRGVKDEKGAAQWYEKAASKGFAPAQYALGQLYNEGRGVDKNYAKANEWFRKGAEMGLDEAQFRLGYNLLMNRGEKKLPEGADWIQQAARQGNPEAQYYLGILLAFGQGLPKDPAAAKDWLTKAQSNGFTKARRVIHFMEGRFSTPIRAYNSETGDEMEITVDYPTANPLTSLGLFTRNPSVPAGMLKFNIRYKLRSPYPYCHVKPEGYGFEYSGGYPALKEKEGTTTPYIARETEGILNDNIRVVMYYEKTNQDNVKQRVKLNEVEVPIVAVWL